ncbi:MAG: TlpA family protein disulfide reductase [Flavobacterium sp.]|jgi:thiol-disulfide isomerase/thioredoxin|nr:TlpA family protein disulfide reductase [Flavobacterium sp.]
MTNSPLSIRYLLCVLFGILSFASFSQSKIQLKQISNEESFHVNPYYYDLKPLPYKKELNNIPVLDSLKVFYLTLDPFQFAFDKFRSGELEKERALTFLMNNRVDTLSLSKKPLSQELIVVIGFKEDRQILIADSNNDGDLENEIRYEFGIDEAITSTKLLELQPAIFKFEYFVNDKIYNFERQFVLVPNKNHSFKQHIKKENIPYLTFVKFIDSWSGEWIENKKTYSLIINDPNSNTFYFKEKNVKLREDEVFNRQYEYRLGDTVAIEKSYYKVTRDDGLKTVFLNKVENYQGKKYKIGDVIPNYVVADLNNKSKTIKQFLNSKEYLLLEFWGTWCGPCLRLQPEIEKFYARNKTNIDLLGVAVDESVEVVKDYVDKKQLPWEHAFVPLNTKNRLIDELKIIAFPSLLLLDKNNKIIFYGAGSKENLQEIEELIHKR